MSKNGNSKKEKNGGAFLISDETKEIKIEHNGAAGVFRYCDLGAFAHNQILTRHGKFSPETGKMSLDMAGYIHEFLKAVLIEAPFELTDANLKRMRPAVATKLMNSIGTGIKIEDAGRHSCA